jgi:uroporphyrinogen decarboxylase
VTSRERLLTTFRRELPDRTPTSYPGRPDVDARLQAHLGLDTWPEVLERLGVEETRGVGSRMRFPAWEARTDKLAKGGAWPGAGTEYVWHDERTFEDQWGVVWRIGSEGRYLQHISSPLEHAESPDEYDFPGPERLEWAPDLAEQVAEYQRQGYYVGAGVEQPYKTAWRLRGMEQNLADYYENREFKEKLYDKIHETWEEIARRTVSAGVDQFSIGGDIAMQDRMLITPRLWREVDKPRLARLIGIARGINPEVHIYLHSDGNLYEVMDDLVEIGFDIINPVQPECMDPAEVKRRWGDRVSLAGCGSLQQVLPKGSVRDVRNHVNWLIENCGYNGGLMLAPSNALQPDIPPENIVAFYDAAREFDLGKFR